MNIKDICLQQMKIELWNQDYLWFHQVQNHEWNITDRILDEMEIYEYSDAYIDRCSEDVDRAINNILSSAEWFDFVMEYLEEMTDAHEQKYHPEKYYGVRR